MRGFGWEPTGWESQACQSAAKALEAVRPDASYGEMRAIAREASALGRNDPVALG